MQEDACKNQIKVSTTKAKKVKKILDKKAGCGKLVFTATMPQILIPVGDLIDRLSILTRKMFFGEDQVYSEANAIIEGLSSMGYDGELIAESMKLAQMNFEIWNLENKMRRDPRDIRELKQEELAEYGIRSLSIRELNKKRIRHKNSINDITNSYREIKVQHASQ